MNRIKNLWSYAAMAASLGMLVFAYRPESQFWSLWIVFFCMIMFPVAWNVMMMEASDEIRQQSLLWVPLNFLNIVYLLTLAGWMLLFGGMLGSSSLELSRVFFTFLCLMTVVACTMVVFQLLFSVALLIWYRQRAVLMGVATQVVLCATMNRVVWLIAAGI